MSVALSAPALPERFAIIGISLIVVGAALFVAGILLATDCGPQIISRGYPATSVCTYPFQSYGVDMVYAGVILFPLLAFHTFVRYEALKGRKWTGVWSPSVLTLIVGTLATFGFWVIALAFF